VKKSAVFALVLTLFTLSIRTEATYQASLILPAVKRDTLLNGLQLLVLEHRGTGTVSVHLRINSGAMFDLANKGGLADLTGIMIAKGGGGWTARNVTDTLESLGLTFKTTVSWDSTDIRISGPADSLETIFELLGKLLVTPAFDEKELEALKAERSKLIEGENAVESNLVTAKALEAVYGTHPYGHPLIGSVESLQKITRHDLLYYHSRFYAANNSQLAISGDTTAADVTRLARARLGAWKKDEKIPATFRPPEAVSGPKVIVIDRSTGDASVACIAQAGPSRRDQNYFASVIAADLFSQANAKTAATHAVTIQTRLESRLIGGPLLVTLSGPRDKVNKAVEEVLANIARLQTEALQDQVESSRQRLISSTAEKLRTPEGSLELLLDIELYGLGRDYLVSFVDRVNAVSQTDVITAAQSFLKPKSVAIAIAGPASELETPLRKIGSITVLR
jgi:zinc protease